MALLCRFCFSGVLAVECGSGFALPLLFFWFLLWSAAVALLCRFCFSVFLLLSQRLATADSDGLEVVFDMDAVDLEAVDGLHLSRGGGALEPGGGTPAILVGDRHQAMLDRILMHVVQPGEIGTLVGQPGVPVVEPDLPFGSRVQFVDVQASAPMQLSQQILQGRRAGLRVRDEVVVVGEHRPGFQLPAPCLELRQQLRFQVIEAFGSLEEVGLVRGGGGDEVRPLGAATMQRRVRPIPLGHWKRGARPDSRDRQRPGQRLQHALDLDQLLGRQVQDLLDELVSAGG